MIIPVILAGGSGTRLWPLSREQHPKQLLPLVDSRTMLQNTVLRLAGLENVSPPLVICNEKHRYMVTSQLRGIGRTPSALVLEPMGRNTAPAVAVAALKADAIAPDALMLVLPADHLIQHATVFHEAVQTGAALARSGYLVTFGIVPNRPETGYGYIKKGGAVALPGNAGKEGPAAAFAIDRFVEKPAFADARAYVTSGDYCWNSGMFIFSASRVLAELAAFAPDILNACRLAVIRGENRDGFFYLDQEAFGSCRSDSIDYAVMEHTQQGAMIPLDAGWDDVGSWEALWNVGEKDKDGNVIFGNVRCVGVKNTLIRAQSRLVAALGVQDLAIVETPDALLVSSLTNTQGVKQIVSELKGRPETESHARKTLSWGYMETLDAENDVRIRKITLLPGQSLLFDAHGCRAVTWQALGGVAAFRQAGEPRQIPRGAAVTVGPDAGGIIENTGHEPAVILEVSHGFSVGVDYLGAA